MGWLVRINGKSEDLTELSRFMNSPGCSVIEYNGEFYLKSTEFDSLAEASEVLEKGKELASRIIGAMKYALGWRNPITAEHVVQVNDDGSKKAYVFLHDTIHLSSSISITKKDENGVISTFHSAQQIPGLIELANENQNVAKALRLYGRGNLGYADLYIIYEVIEKDVGGISQIVGSRWSSRSAIKLFKHTANHPDAIGDSARHGVMSTQPPRNPMPISEAKALVEKILQSWLRSM